MQRLGELQVATYKNYQELFVPTEMLYIEERIGGTSVEIFVDTGAQTNVLSIDSPFFCVWKKSAI